MQQQAQNEYYLTKIYLIPIILYQMNCRNKRKETNDKK